MYLKEELQHIKELSTFHLVQYFQDGVVARATGNGFDNDLYITIRAKLLKNKSLEKLLPEWIKTKRTIDHFWTFIKGRYSTYEERRKFLWEEFTPVLNYLESKVKTPIDTKLVFNEVYINKEWEKALNRKTIEPEGAITMAKTLLESTMKHILDEENITYKEKDDLPKLYKKVAKRLNLAPEQHQEQIFKQILQGATSVIYGLGTVRNKLGDAHGKGKARVKPSVRHSELVVNLAGVMANFLFKTYEEKLINEIH